jgi:hypothetical protein
LSQGGADRSHQPDRFTEETVEEKPERGLEIEPGAPRTIELGIPVELPSGESATLPTTYHPVEIVAGAKGEAVVDLTLDAGAQTITAPGAFNFPPGGDIQLKTVVPRVQAGVMVTIHNRGPSTVFVVVRRTTVAGLP